MRWDQDGSREKLFVTYAETPTDWKRVTVSYDISNAPKDSFEQKLAQERLQSDKMELLWSLMKISDIKFYTTVTNLKIETVDGRTHPGVTEDINEMIPYPPTRAVKHLEYSRFEEDQVAMDSHLTGFAYRVVVGAEIFVRLDIPGPHNAEDFLQELDALHRMQSLSHIITLKGIVVDNELDAIKGSLTKYAEAGALGDILYDFEGRSPWPQREQWAYQIVHGVADVHNEGLLVGNLTLAQLAVDAEDSIKFLGVAGSRGVAVGWESPGMFEPIASGHRISHLAGPKSELYQLGMVLWALATEDDYPDRQPRPLNIADEIPRYYRNIVAICLSARPRDRMGASELLRMFLAHSLGGSIP